MVIVIEGGPLEVSHMVRILEFSGTEIYHSVFSGTKTEKRFYLGTIYSEVVWRKEGTLVTL
jgi:hypothetical protein